MTQENGPGPNAQKRSSFKRSVSRALSVLTFVIALLAVAGSFALFTIPRGAYGGFYFTPVQQGTLWFIFFVVIFSWILAARLAWNARKEHKRLWTLTFISSIVLLVVGCYILFASTLAARGKPSLLVLAPAPSGKLDCAIRAG